MLTFLALGASVAGLAPLVAAAPLFVALSASVLPFVPPELHADTNETISSRQMANVDFLILAVILLPPSFIMEMRIESLSFPESTIK